MPTAPGSGRGSDARCAAARRSAGTPAPARGDQHHHRGDPARHPGERRPGHRRRRTGPQVAQPRPARDHDDEHALQPAPHLVRRVHLQDRLPLHRRHQVRRPATASRATAIHSVRPSPASATAVPQPTIAARQRHALAPHPADPAGRQPAQHRADRDRREQPADRGRTAEALRRPPGTAPAASRTPSR